MGSSRSFSYRGWTLEFISLGCFFFGAITPKRPLVNQLLCIPCFISIDHLTFPVRPMLMLLCCRPIEFNFVTKLCSLRSSPIALRKTHLGNLQLSVRGSSGKKQRLGEQETLLHAVLPIMWLQRKRGERLPPVVLAVCACDLQERACNETEIQKPLS